jgi:hypothetical protein
LFGLGGKNLLQVIPELRVEFRDDEGKEQGAQDGGPFHPQ